MADALSQKRKLMEISNVSISFNKKDAHKYFMNPALRVQGNTAEILIGLRGGKGVLHIEFSAKTRDVQKIIDYIRTENIAEEVIKHPHLAKIREDIREMYGLRRYAFSKKGMDAAIVLAANNVHVKRNGRLVAYKEPRIRRGKLTLRPVVVRRKIKREQKPPYRMTDAELKKKIEKGKLTPEEKNYLRARIVVRVAKIVINKAIAEGLVNKEEVTDEHKRIVRRTASSVLKNYDIKEVFLSNELKKDVVKKAFKALKSKII